MPIYRGPDGKIIEERTKRIRDDELTGLAGSAADTAGKSAAGSEDLTKIVSNADNSSPEPSRGPAASARDEEKTVLFEMREGSLQEKEPGASVDSFVADPVVAWLAVIKGPGMGNVQPCGYGTNSIGRGGDARVNIDFGDMQISRGEHAILTYDPRGRKYYIQHGSGNHLTYLEAQPVLTPTELKDRAQISIGETTLMFVPLCGESFDWQDLKGDG